METPEQISFLSLLLPLVSIAFVIAIGVVLLNQQFQKKLLRQLLEKESLKRQHEKDLLTKSIRVQEDERKRFAQDLHDELGAALAIGRMQMMQLEREQNRSTELYDKDLSQVRQTLESALASTRRISHDLMPIHLKEEGLWASLEGILQRIEKNKLQRVKFKFPESKTTLSWEEELGLYRICNELLNNTIRHSKADCIVLEVELSPTDLQLNYQDNGQGLIDDQYQGMGLSNIEARVKSLKGQVTWGNRLEGGFYATILIPNPTQ